VAITVESSLIYLTANRIFDRRHDDKAHDGIKQPRSAGAQAADFY